MLLAPGTATVVALGTDGEVIGFAHALSNSLTAYLAELVVAAKHRNHGVARNCWPRSSIDPASSASTSSAPASVSTHRQRHRPRRNSSREAGAVEDEPALSTVRAGVRPFPVSW
ncbi:MAG: GNAT family N-acetyltransferase [Pseudonocardiaceae bacterium]